MSPWSFLEASLDRVDARLPTPHAEWSGNAMFNTIEIKHQFSNRPTASYSPNIAVRLCDIQHTFISFDICGRISCQVEMIDRTLFSITGKFVEINSHSSNSLGTIFQNFLI